MSQRMGAADPVGASTVPAVSVIMPAFNTEGYIERAIRSALNQTCGDLEVIVVDDGSTDRTRDIALSLQRADARVRVMSQPNAGISVARNRALAAARGRHLALLDSDDEWMPTFLDRALAVLASDPTIDIVSVNAWNRGSRRDGEPYWPTVEGLRKLSRLEIIAGEDTVSILSVFRREVIDTVGAFDTSMRRSEDYDLWLRAAAAGFGFAQLLQPLAWYQRRPDSLSADELEMLMAAESVYRKSRDRFAGCPAEQTALDCQVRRFERERRIFEAKRSFRGGDFRHAAERFKALHNAYGGVLFGLLAAVMRLAPQQLLWADRTRRFLRQTRLN